MMDMTAQIMGNPMVDWMSYDSTKNTLIHVINLKDGTYETVDSGWSFTMMHTGNQFVKDNKIIIDATTL